ncbi:MAG: hypothetical protein U9532_03890, partial ['Conium maculatum' witches'-broom phytoplasma]|nr:hypothetical protein ['Conium maculatum' witches'-broom phytoplasma]
MNTFISVQTFLESTKKNKYIDYSPLIKGVFCFQIEKVDDYLKKYNLFIEDEKTKNKIILKTKLKPN